MEVIELGSGTGIGGLTAACLGVYTFLALHESEPNPNPDPNSSPNANPNLNPLILNLTLATVVTLAMILTIIIIAPWS